MDEKTKKSDEINRRAFIDRLLRGVAYLTVANASVYIVGEITSVGSGKLIAGAKTWKNYGACEPDIKSCAGCNYKAGFTCGVPNQTCGVTTGSSCLRNNGTSYSNCYICQ